MCCSVGECHSQSMGESKGTGTMALLPCIPQVLGRKAGESPGCGTQQVPPSPS